MSLFQNERSTHEPDFAWLPEASICVSLCIYESSAYELSGRGGSGDELWWWWRGYLTNARAPSPTLWREE